MYVVVLLYDNPAEANLRTAGVSQGYLLSLPDEIKQHLVQLAM